MRKLLAAALALVVSPALAQDKERLSANDLSVRTALTFKMPDAVVQKLLPPGFEINSPTAGPAKGSNLGMTLIDYVMAQDPEGKPLPTRTTVAMNIPSKITATGQAVGVVFSGFIAHGGAPGPYFNFGAAKINIDRRAHTDADGKSVVDESWEIKADDGNAVAIALQYTRAVPTRGKVEAKLYSGTKPDFWRIYRFEQAADVLRSTATGVDRVAKISINATGPKLSPLFDGSQQLVSVTSIPYYARSIYLAAQ
jgi:hypothetical protein